MLDNEEAIDMLCCRPVPSNVSLTSFASWLTAWVFVSLSMHGWHKKSVLNLSVWRISTKCILFHLFPYLTHIYKAKAVFIFKVLGKIVVFHAVYLVVPMVVGCLFSTPMWMFGERIICVCVGLSYLFIFNF